MSTRRLKVLLMIAGAVAGLFAYVLLADKVSPKTSFSMNLSRADIMERATAYMTGLGYPVESLQQDGWTVFDASTHLILQSQVGMEEANRLCRVDSIYAHAWVITWYDRSLTISANKETYRMWLSPAGLVLGFEHVIPDSVARVSIDPADARARAEAFLVQNGIAVGDLTLRSSTDTKLAGRVDYRFIWARAGSSLETTVLVRIQGSEIGAFRRNTTAVGEIAGTIGGFSTIATFLYITSFALTFVLLFFLVSIFLRKYHEGEVGTKTAFMVFLGVFLLSVLGSVNEIRVLGSTWGVGDLNKFQVRIAALIITVFVIQVSFAVMVFSAWSVGESSSRSVWSGKLTGADSILFRKFLTADVAEGVLRGYAWGLMLTGAYAVLLYALIKGLRFGLWNNSLGAVPESLVPALQPILTALFVALTCEIIFRLFFLSYIGEKTRHRWIAVFVSSVLWTIAGWTMWDLPFGMLVPSAGLVVHFMFGVIFAMLFLRYDLVTVVVADFVIVALSAAIPFLAGSSGGLHTTLAIFAAAFLLPVPIALVGLARGERFSFTVDTMPAHIKRISERERMAKELEIARNVQMSLLPKSEPQVSGFELAGICIPALAVGGDYYDFVALGPDRVGIAIGDVSGKGVPAAIYMTLTKGILQSHAEDHVSPKQVLSKVNSLMYRTIERNTFVSMFYAILDIRRKTLTMARAGQCPMIMTQRAESGGSFISPRGIALGLEGGAVFDSVLEEQEISLTAGEVLAFYTDGFTEARNGEGEEFGEERLMASLGSHRSSPARDIIREVCTDLDAFTGSMPQHDDMTMVVVKVTR